MGLKSKVQAKIAETKRDYKAGTDHVKQLKKQHPEAFTGGRRGR